MVTSDRRWRLTSTVKDAETHKFYRCNYNDFEKNDLRCSFEIDLFRMRPVVSSSIVLCTYTVNSFVRLPARSIFKHLIDRCAFFNDLSLFVISFLPASQLMWSLPSTNSSTVHGDPLSEEYWSPSATFKTI